MLDLVLSLIVLGIIALSALAWLLWRRNGFTRHVLLLIVAVLVLAANLLLWTLPLPDAPSPLEQAAEGQG